MELDIMVKYKNFLIEYRGINPQGQKGYRIYDLDRRGLKYRPSIKYLIGTVDDAKKFVDALVGENKSKGQATLDMF